MYCLSSFSKIKKDGLWLENLDLCLWYLASKTSRLMMYIHNINMSLCTLKTRLWHVCLFPFVWWCCPSGSKDEPSVQSATIHVRSHCPFKIFQKMMCIKSYQIVGWMPCIVSYREISVSLQPYLKGIRFFFRTFSPLSKTAFIVSLLDDLAAFELFKQRAKDYLVCVCACVRRHVRA